MVTILWSVVKLLDVLTFIILIKCIMTWIPGATQNKLYEVFCVLTDPIEDPIRSIVYKYVNGPIDFSPVIALLLIRVVQRLLMGMMY
ncbi:MAG: YggT family protein [Romboutsia sp.]